MWAVLLFLALAAGGTGAIEDKCGACKVVSLELQKRLDNEGVRNHIDLRHRLDPNGVRQGKVIPFKQSEQRITELYDGLCEDVRKYGLAHPEEGEEGSPVWVKAESLGKGVTRPQGVVYKKAQRQAEQMEIKHYCARMVEETEEEVAEAIFQDEASGNLDKIMCHELTKACKPPKKGGKKKTEL